MTHDRNTCLYYVCCRSIPLNYLLPDAVDVPVGFYTTVSGLGLHPDDVTFTGIKGVYCEEGASNFTLGALENFWRSAENFRSQATFQ